MLGETIEIVLEDGYLEIENCGDAMGFRLWDFDRNLVDEVNWDSENIKDMVFDD